VVVTLGSITQSESRQIVPLGQQPPPSVGAQWKKDLEGHESGVSSAHGGCRQQIMPAEERVEGEQVEERGQQTD
jgi:hypothetical protein